MAVSSPPLTAPKLLDLLIEYCITHIETFCTVVSPDKTPVTVFKDVFIPSNIADLMVARLCDQALERDKMDDLMSVFCNTDQVALQRVNLNRSNISNRTIASLARHKLFELNISNCRELTVECLPDLFKQTSLKVLDISKNVLLLAGFGHDLCDFPLENLRVLNIGFTELSTDQLERLLQPLVNLVSLDLSRVLLKGDDLTFLRPLSAQLRSLVLHDCNLVSSGPDFLCSLKELRHLDISVADSNLPLTLTNSFLKTMVKSLPHLSSLDISGHFIEAGKTTTHREETKDHISLDEVELKDKTDTVENEDSVYQGADGDTQRMKCSIAGLRGLSKPLEFLGLLGLDESELEHLPAIKVAGVFSEDQILNTIEVYLKRRSYLLEGLNSFFELLRAVECVNPSRAVELILAAMRYCPRDNQVQVSGSASLYHLTRGTYNNQLSIHHRQAIITCLLDAIETITDSMTLLQNCGLTLLNFRIPDEFRWQFERVVKNLVKLAQTEDPHGLLQRIYVHMCNSIVCHVEGEQKLLVGRLGIIKCMLSLITDRLERNRCDEVMETAWSTLWNVTDETADNCQMFLDGKGMELFIRCREAFPDKPELLRNMMGLIGNVAEVQGLRPHLMNYASVFMELLGDWSDGIEVSYNAAGTLAHIAADGPSTWSIEHPQRCEVLQQMTTAIDSWELNTQRNINYRSFGPILRLLLVEHTPVVQHWAVWALANLCTVSPSKYCKLLEKEEGLPLLKEVCNNPRTIPIVRRLAQQTLQLVEENREEQPCSVHVV
ncbi:protein zer-1 homolog [Asterias rubens]|uniref:protein zer-1 homolog n=1 Tax=Asterias rubens TaxID=7604 RepID=UPI0014558CFD|nr:protein zer-1 homolog [Asterias rubens]